MRACPALAGTASCNASCGGECTCACASGFQELNGNCAEEQPQGAACSSASPCAAGLFCESSLCCSEECGDDERCNENGEGCRCAAGLTRVGTECLAPQGAGASCAATPCQGGLTRVRDRCCAIDCGESASCSNNGSRCNCDDGFFLTDDGCAPERDNGSDCSDDEQCGSGACGSNGRCCAAPCSPTNASQCGHTGACSTNGACEFWGSNTTCAAADCDDGEATAAAQCNGSGTCVVPRAQSCGAYNCGGTTCRSSCTNNNHCSGDNFCDDGDCTEPLDDGDACSADAECDSGNCVDGLCCNIDCNAMAQSTCGQTGSCNANGRGCQLWSSATQCQSASCGSGAASAAAFCDGSGSCRAPVVTDCEGHQCNGTSCDTNCNGDDDQCIAGQICEGSDCIDPECTDSDDCSRIEGLESCNAGRCEIEAVLAQYATVTCATAVAADAGTDLRPYCTPQLAVAHALNIGPARVILRGEFTSGMVIDGDLDIVGDASLPPTITGDNTGTAIDVIGAFEVSVADVTFEDWAIGIAMAEGSEGTLSRVVVDGGSTSVSLDSGDYTLTEVVLSGGGTATIRGSLSAQSLRVTGMTVGLNVWGDASDIRGSTFVRNAMFGLGALSIATESTLLEDNSFVDNFGNAIWLGTHQLSPALIQGNNFEGNNGYGVDCDVTGWFTGENTFDANATDVTCPRNRAMYE